MLVSGCESTRYLVGVNSINDGEKIMSTKKVIIFSGIKDITKEDLQFKEYERYVTKAFIKKGYVVTNNPEEADIGVFLTYGIGGPQEHTYNYSMPVFGQTGVSSAQTFGTVQGFGNSATYSGTTTYTPSYGIVGATSGVGTVVTYTRFMRLDAYDLAGYRESKKEKHLWRTDTSSTGTSGDLRMIFPVMVAAAAPYIGENTEKTIEINLEENDKRIIEIKSTLNEIKEQEKAKTIVKSDAKLTQQEPVNNFSAK